MRAAHISSALALLLSACSGGTDQKSGAKDGAKVTEPKDAASAERYLIAELRWTEVIDRHFTPGVSEEPVADVFPSESGYQGRVVLPGYAARPADKRPEIRTGQWTVALPETSLRTFELAIDPNSGYRLLVLSRGWKRHEDGLLPDVEMHSNHRIILEDGSGSGPNMTGLAKSALGRSQAFSVSAQLRKASRYFEFVEARYVDVTEQPGATVERGVADTANGQREKEAEWPIQEISITPSKSSVPARRRGDKGT